VGDVEEDPEDLIGGSEWGPPGEGSGEKARALPRKKTGFFDRNGVFW